MLFEVRWVLAVGPPTPSWALQINTNIHLKILHHQEKCILYCKIVHCGTNKAVLVASCIMVRLQIRRPVKSDVKIWGKVWEELGSSSCPDWMTLSGYTDDIRDISGSFREASCLVEWPFPYTRKVARNFPETYLFFVPRWNDVFRILADIRGKAANLGAIIYKIFIKFWHTQLFISSSFLPPFPPNC